MKYIIKESQLELILESQEYLNFLLDKINDEGYDSLTHREKDALIRISQGEEVYDEPNELPISDEVYDPNRMFLHYISKYGELEVDDVLFKFSLLGNRYLELLSDNYTFSIEPNFEENQVIFYNPDTDDSFPINFKNVPETTEEMRGLAVKFLYNKLPDLIRDQL